MLIYLQLADFANLTQPWLVDPKVGEDLLDGFKNSDLSPCSLELLEREYCKETGQPYPIAELLFVRSWMLFRVRHDTSELFVTVRLTVLPYSLP